MASIFERVRDLVTEQLGVEEDEVVIEASFIDDLNADSLDLVELIMSFEEEFSNDGDALEISDAGFEKCNFQIFLIFECERQDLRRRNE